MVYLLPKGNPGNPVNPLPLASVVFSEPSFRSKRAVLFSAQEALPELQDLPQEDVAVPRCRTTNMGGGRGAGSGVGWGEVFP